MKIAYISLGSNMGNSAQHLAFARERLEAEQGLHIAEASPIYRTEPQGLKDQDWFSNQVLRVECRPCDTAPQGWTPQSLVQSLLSMETALGRVRSDDPALRFGPRIIDMDLLLFAEESSTDPICLLPHPRMHQRACILVPLQNVLEQDTVPKRYFDVEAALAALDYSVSGQEIYQAGC